MSQDLPFRAEYAKSGRAACKGCKEKIDKDILRLAVMVQSPMFDGKMPNWYHTQCFFMKARVKTVDDIAHFDQLRWEDQQYVRGKVVGTGDAFIKSKISSNSALNDYFTEYAKSNRSVCRGCEQKIEKGLVRISKKDYDSQKAKMYGAVDLWYHVDCFAKDREELDYYASGDMIQGFHALSAEDKANVKSKLPKLKNAGSKRPADSGSGTSSKKQKKNEEEEKLRVQNQLIFKYRDWLQNQLTKKDMQYLLEYNDQEVPPGESRLLDRLSDCMAFGALASCPECKNGQLVYMREGYRCHGDISEWTKCQHITKSPQRKPFKVPDDMLEEHDFLNKYKYVKQDRVFSAEAVPSASNSSQGSNSSKLSTSIPSTSRRPLEGMKFVVVGKLNNSKAEITSSIQSLGGKVTTKVDKSTAAVISTEAEVKKMNKKIHEAKDADVQVVSEDFVDAVQNGGAILMIQNKSICNWGSDPQERIEKFEGPKSKRAKADDEMFTKSVPRKLVMKVKGGAAVDPDSGLDHQAHVLDDKSNIYNAVLGLVDTERGTNSYYKLQVLESDKNYRYWLFRSWGRVGTTIGGKKLEPKNTKAEVVESFHSLYEEKTGNSWNNRKNFVKKPSRFYPLDIDYGQDDEKVKRLSDLQASSKSKLHKAVKDLICMIFDVESMKKAMLEFEIDLKKMPLGKLSSKQIKKAYSVLTELLELIESGGSKTQFTDASNRFYTMIPHDFGMKKPTDLNEEALVKKKIEMLDSLLEMEVAYNLLKGAEEDTSHDPIDIHYSKLKTDIQVLDRESNEFITIHTYVKNTHATTHNQYDLEILEIFKISRQGEYSRYKPFKKLHNRKLLWHGSRVANYAGILSQGLRIAPPEAPVTGYMFGKGVYFADMVSKSANYCCANKSSPTGLMLLCEVALGDMHELANADFITSLPSGKHSTKGIGKTAPDPAKSTILSGVEVPLGPAVPVNSENSSLLYNEYIVYDVAQVNIKYMLKMNFKYKC